MTIVQAYALTIDVREEDKRRWVLCSVKQNALVEGMSKLEKPKGSELMVERLGDPCSKTLQKS